MAHDYLDPVVDHDVDTVILGCTHYPFLNKAIHQILGESITLIDTSEAVVRQLKRQLNNPEKKVQTVKAGSIIFLSSKDEKTLLKMAKELMRSDLNAHAIDAKLLRDLE